jgi:hypothetical protein
MPENFIAWLLIFFFNRRQPLLMHDLIYFPWK